MQDLAAIQPVDLHQQFTNVRAGIQTTKVAGQKRKVMLVIRLLQLREDTVSNIGLLFLRAIFASFPHVPRTCQNAMVAPPSLAITKDQWN